MINLELVDIEDILKEIENRYDDYIFMASRTLPDGFKEFREGQNGDRMNCMGMMQFMNMRIAAELCREAQA